MKNEFYELTAPLYRAFMQEQDEVSVPEEFTDITRAVVEKCGWRTRVAGYKTDFTVPAVPEGDGVVLALSSGLDSVYLLHRLIERGHDVTAFHVRGLNKSSAKTEAEAARRIARLNKVRFVEAGFNAPAQVFPDNPFKNQLILSMMLGYGAEHQIYRYAVGSDWTTPLSEGVVGYTLTDTAEVYESYWQGIKKHFPQAELVFIGAEEKKYHRLKYLAAHYPQSLEAVSSCVAPQRFREHWRRNNMDRYGVQLLPGRCGSCYKCAMEYILLCEAGAVKADAAFTAHCWDILATSKTSHRPDLFSKDLPVKERLKNLMDYGS